MIEGDALVTTITSAARPVQNGKTIKAESLREIVHKLFRTY